MMAWKNVSPTLKVISSKKSLYIDSLVTNYEKE